MPDAPNWNGTSDISSDCESSFADPGGNAGSIGTMSGEKRSIIRRCLTPEALAAVPLIVVAVAVLGAAPYFSKPTSITNMVHTYFVAALATSVLAAVMLVMRPLRRWCGVLAIVGAASALSLNFYCAITPHKPGATTAFKGRWEYRRKSNSLDYLLRHGNGLSKITYRNHIALREFLKDKRIIAYEQEALPFRYLIGVTFVSAYDVEEYAHVLGASGYDRAMELEHIEFRIDARRKSRKLIIVPEWVEGAETLYVLTLKNQPVHVLAPRKLIEELAE
ncbi:MAG: hypothetical protein H6818_22150 [Phycisphaerales bacterium]|nr:hypothetical protein [Phycisphaerales bacterium]MCB9862495.1 hypothetical protein [Phycisphaerales bacterium]